MVFRDARGSLQRGYVASMLVGVEQYGLGTQYALCQAAGCARAASKLHCATSLRRVRAVLRNLMASVALL